MLHASPTPQHLGWNKGTAMKSNLVCSACGRGRAPPYCECPVRDWGRSGQSFQPTFSKVSAMFGTLFTSQPTTIRMVEDYAS